MFMFLVIFTSYIELCVKLMGEYNYRSITTIQIALMSQIHFIILISNYCILHCMFRVSQNFSVVEMYSAVICLPNQMVKKELEQNYDSLLQAHSYKKA